MVALDTLKASRRLRDAGFEEAQAEALVGAFAEDIGERLATKDDVVLLGSTLENKIALLEQRVNLRIALAAGGITTALLAAIAIATGIIVSRL